MKGKGGNGALRVRIGMILNFIEFLVSIVFAFALKNFSADA